MYPSGVQLWDVSSMAFELYMSSCSSLLFLSKVPYSVVIGLLLVLSVGLGLAYCGGKACQELQNTYTPLRLMDEHIIRFSFCGVVPSFGSVLRFFFLLVCYMSGQIGRKLVVERKWGIYHSVNQSSLQAVYCGARGRNCFQLGREILQWVVGRYNTNRQNNGRVE